MLERRPAAWHAVPSIAHPRHRVMAIAGAAVVLVVALIARGLWTAYLQPSIYPDTASYVALGRALVGLPHDAITGARTPLYPLLLAACGFHPAAVQALQAALGALTALALYLTTYRITRRVPLAVIAGLCWATNSMALSLESCLLTETLSVFLLALWLLIIVLPGDRPGYAAAIAASVLTACCILARPASLVLLLPLAGYALFQARAARDGRLLTAYGVPVVVLLAGWMAVNGLVSGKPVISSRAWYGLLRVNHALVPTLPDRYAAVRDAITRHAARHPVTGMPVVTQATIWAAGPALHAAGIDICGDALRGPALWLVTHHPRHYLGTVLRSIGAACAPRLPDVAPYGMPRPGATIHPAMRGISLLPVIILGIGMVVIIAGAGHAVTAPAVPIPMLVTLMATGLLLLVAPFFFEIGEEPRLAFPATYALLAAAMALAGAAMRGRRPNTGHREMSCNVI